MLTHAWAVESWVKCKCSVVCHDTSWQQSSWERGRDCTHTWSGRQQLREAFKNFFFDICQCVWVCPHPESIRGQFHPAPQCSPTLSQLGHWELLTKVMLTLPGMSCRSNCWEITRSPSEKPSCLCVMHCTIDCTAENMTTHNLTCFLTPLFIVIYQADHDL